MTKDKLKELLGREFEEKFNSGLYTVSGENAYPTFKRKDVNTCGSHEPVFIDPFDEVKAYILDVVDRLALDEDESLKITRDKLKEINPNFNGHIFIQDSYMTPPNNWTRINLRLLIQKILTHQSDKFKENKCQ